MNQAEQAQKGFKTFILTLSISLIVFSAVYHVVTNSSNNGDAPDIDSVDKQTSDASTVFGKLANQKVDTQARNVLAGSDVNTTDTTVTTTPTTTTTPTVVINQTAEPTQASGTPNGGVTSITLGLLTSIAVFLYGMFVISKDPRRMALKGFESSITNDL